MAPRRRKLATVVAKGDREVVLTVLAATLTDRMDSAPNKAVAGLARQLTGVLVELAPDDLAEQLDSLALRLAKLIDSPETETENVAALAAQLRNVLGRLAGVEKPERSTVDELDKRRQARRLKGTKVPQRRTRRQ